MRSKPWSTMHYRVHYFLLTAIEYNWLSFSALTLLVGSKYHISTNTTKHIKADLHTDNIRNHNTPTIFHHHIKQRFQFNAVTHARQHHQSSWHLSPLHLANRSCRIYIASNDFGSFREVIPKSTACSHQQLVFRPICYVWRPASWPLFFSLSANYVTVICTA